LSKPQAFLSVEAAGTKRMIEKASEWRAEPLVWGSGARLFEVFLEPTCPFSTKAFGKLDQTLQGVGADAMTLRIWLLSQPWHLFSGVTTRCVLAASTLPEGKGGAKRVLESVAAHREEFEPVEHCRGPQMAMAPADIIARIEKYADLKLADAFAVPALTNEMKRHAKYARQNGIHVSPTFMIDGLVQADMSSGDEISSWVSRLSAP
jgi:hypothetical protein